MKKSQMILWIVALIVGVGIGLLKIESVDTIMNFIATIYTRLFRLLAVPTIVLAVITTLASLGGGREMGKMFKTTLTYTLLTTTAAALVALALYLIIAPGNLPANIVGAEDINVGTDVKEFTYTDHILSVIPDNIVKPFLDGNVLALLLLCFAVGIALSKMPDNGPKHSLMNGLLGLQDLLFMLIKWLIIALPLGIVAFA
ncbi:MAG: dicarboxylate/amino acid:cation symporter, partial [Muribaculaceae bacterium]|nr:dicarboxylate/amino acid:cation symporter [Muribaculaceae bacterium]